METYVVLTLEPPGGSPPIKHVVFDPTVKAPSRCMIFSQLCGHCRNVYPITTPTGTTCPGEPSRQEVYNLSLSPTHGPLGSCNSGGRRLESIDDLPLPSGHLPWEPPPPLSSPMHPEADEDIERMVGEYRKSHRRF